MKKNVLRFILNREVFTFLLIGAFNTILSMMIMFGLYNIYNFGYWISSFIAYIITAILGFILNRKYTFKSNDSILKCSIKFFTVIIGCYIIAFSIAQPMVENIIFKFQVARLEKISDQIAMLLGQVIFTMLNYIGQKYFAFKK